MPVDVSPDAARPTHHAALIGAGKRVGLMMSDDDGNPLPTGMARGNLETTSLKISQGNAQYSDLELPFTIVPQEDWSGGQNQERFEDNVTKYLEGYRVHGIFSGRIFNGPLEGFMKGYRDHWYNAPGIAQKSLGRQVMLPTGSRRYLAIKTTPDASVTAQAIWLPLKAKGSPGDLTVKFRSDSAGDPGAVLKTETLAATALEDGALMMWVRVAITGGQAVVSGTPYWIYLTAAATDDDLNHWVLLADGDGTVGLTKESSDDIAWAASSIDLYYRLTDTDPDWGGWLFKYKEADYFLTRPPDGSAPKLFLNGWRGAADPNTGNLTRLNDSTQTGWAGNKAAGGIVKIIDGPGSEEERPWREVASSVSGVLNVDAPWLVEHTTSTVYVVVGTDEWNEKTGHGITKAPTDRPLVAGGQVYIAQGSATNYRKFREYNNAGVWTTNYAADGTAGNKADIMTVVDDSTNGPTVWRVLNDDVKASEATTVTWPAELAFAAAKSVGEETEKAVRLVAYVDTDNDDPIPYCIKRGSFHAHKLGKWKKIPLDEMKTVESETTGQAALVHNTFLYFTLLKGLELWNDDVLDDVGPTKDRGLPKERVGSFSDLLGYPGRFFGAVDPGSAGISSVLMEHGIDEWEEHYRAPLTGRRIRALGFQNVPGPKPDRMLFLEGGDLMWLAFASGSTNPLTDDEYLFCPEAAVTLSRMHAGLQDVVKLWASLKIVADELLEDEQWIELDYKLDDETSDWVTLDTRFDSSPSEEAHMTDYTEEEVSSVTGRFLLARIRMNTTSAALTPVLKAILFDSVIRTPLKHGFTIPVRIWDDDQDLNGAPDDYQRAKDKIDDLSSMAESLDVLTLRTIARSFDNLKVWVEAPELKPSAIAAGKERYTGELVVTQVVRLE